MNIYELLATEYSRIFPSSKEKLDFVEKYLLNKSNLEILDIGCASGEFANQLVSGFDVSVTGIDLDEAMIKEAKTQYGSNPGLQFKSVDMVEFLSNAPERSFDLITCMGNTLVYLESETELSEFLRLVDRSLKDSGSFIIQILNYQNPEIVPGFVFPVLETEKIRFERRYTESEQKGFLEFKTTISNKLTGEEFEDSHLHCAFSSERVAVIAGASGFSEVVRFGGYDEKVAEDRDFFHLLALRKS
jgi:SAM-dependent methyltransferase